jgi:phosphoglucomutase
LIETHDRNDLANLGIIVGFDSRYESFGMAHIMAAVFKAYGIRVYCLDRYAVVPFISYFTKKFKCLLGVMVTGRDAPKHYNGVLIFNS